MIHCVAAVMFACLVAMGGPFATPRSSAQEAVAGDIVDRYYAEFQKPGFMVDELMSFYADDVLFTDPTFEIVARGKEEVRALYRDIGTDRTSYSDIRWDIRQTVSEGDTVVIRGGWSGTFQGCAFDIEFVTLWRLRDGLIAEQTDFFAASSFERQVGWDDVAQRAAC